MAPTRHPILEKSAPILRITGAILLAAGLIHLYAERVVYDARTFGERAALSLGDPRVAAFVAERVADQAIAQRRDLMAYRPLIVASARAIVSSVPFRAGFARAAQSAHTALFSQAAERLALSVPDFGVLVRSALVHDPAIAAKVPPSLRGRLMVGPSGKGARLLLKVAQMGHKFRRRAFVGIGLGSLLLTLGIALPSQRRKALLAGGSALAAVALVLFFLPPITRTALTVSMPRAELRPVAAGVWDAFFGGLRLWALVLAGVGLVLAAAASSFASHLEVEQIGRRAWDRLKRPATTWQGEVGRAVLLTGLGLLAAFRPTATLQAFMVVAGSLLAFEGVRELFVLLPPRLQEAARQMEEAHGGTPKWENVRILFHFAAVGLVVVGLIAGAVFFMRSPQALPRPPALTDACNGDRALCDRRLDEVVFPAAHNSMSAAELPGWMFPNQEKGSVALLGDGIRALLFDVHYGTPIGDTVKTDLQDEKASSAKFEKAVGKEAVDAAMRIRDRLTGPPTGPRGPYLCHGFCELGATPLATMLEGVRDFLVQNPGEVVIFVIEDYVAPADIAAAFKESELERFVYRGPVVPPFPTLRQMIDSDQRLVVFGENDATGVPWYHPAFETIQETPYSFHRVEDFSCRPNRGGTTAPLFQINHWIETTPTPKPSNAAIVNAHDFLLARARQCQKERGKLPNILAVDFALTGDVVEVAAELNGVAPVAATAVATLQKPGQD
jgi:hypothetical protein